MVDGWAGGQLGWVVAGGPCGAGRRAEAVLEPLHLLDRVDDSQRGFEPDAVNGVVWVQRPPSLPLGCGVGASRLPGTSRRCGSCGGGGSRGGGGLVDDRVNDAHVDNATAVDGQHRSRVLPRSSGAGMRWRCRRGRRGIR